MGVRCNQASVVTQVLVGGQGILQLQGTITFYCHQAAASDKTINRARGPHGEGYSDYQEDKFFMEDGLWVEIIITLA